MAYGFDGCKTPVETGIKYNFFVEKKCLTETCPFPKEF
jgi:hypothetical protein